MYDQSPADYGRRDQPRSSVTGGATKRQNASANETKLVLLFFILVVAVYTVIIQHRFHLPDAGGSSKSHKVHGRAEMAALRSQGSANPLSAAGSQANAGQMLDKASAASSGAGGSEADQQRQQQQQQQKQQQQEQRQHRDGAQGSGDPSKAAAVKAAMVHAWGGYEKYAWGLDELLPLEQAGKNSFAGMAATLLDGLSTLWLMGLKAEFGRGREWVAAHLNFTSITQEISLFETNIRVVGGLVAAFDLSGDRLFLSKAVELVDLMLPAMDDSRTGIPANSIWLGHPSSSFRRSASLAECGSLQLEWTALSERSGNSVYAAKSQKVFRAIHDVYPDQGLVPTSFERATVSGGPHFSVGAMADSFYEYLLKLWLLGGQKEDLWRSMWEAAVDDVLDKLVGRTAASNLTYLGISNFGHLEAKQEHLACFFPGNMALGVWAGAVSGPKADRYLQEVARTCYEMYARMPSGLSPEVVMMYDSKDEASEMMPNPPYNILRPESVETFFYLWRITGDDMYREWCWKIFQAFEKHCRVEGGYVGTPDVTRNPPPHGDTQQSFFLAETLKYLYLVFAPDSVLPLDQWVLNTEAHPFRLPQGIRTIATQTVPGKRHRHWRGFGSFLTTA